MGRLAWAKNDDAAREDNNPRFEYTGREKSDFGDLVLFSIQIRANKCCDWVFGPGRAIILGANKLELSILFSKIVKASPQWNPICGISCLIMGVVAGVSVKEYLHSSFSGVDREYRDGAVVERSMPDYLHGKAQSILIALFMALRKELSLYPCAETRMMLRPGRFLIPDVAVFHRKEPGLVPDTPPLIAIEILSPDDRLSEVRESSRNIGRGALFHMSWLVDPAFAEGSIVVTRDCGKDRSLRWANWALRSRRSRSSNSIRRTGCLRGHASARLIASITLFVLLPHAGSPGAHGAIR